LDKDLLYRVKAEAVNQVGLEQQSAQGFVENCNDIIREREKHLAIPLDFFSALTSGATV
jgi:hypothetical protein